MKNKILPSILFAITLPVMAHASCDTLAGRWVNARGSVIVLENTDAQTGRFKGDFLSEASIENGAIFAIAGWVNSSQATSVRPDVVQSLSFTVRWGTTGSITAWTGFCRKTDKGAEIATLWHLVRSNSENDFDHIHSGSDVFVRDESTL